MRLARRELRGGIRGFRIFLACLTLGVTAVAGIGSLTDAVLAGARANAQLLLGGDISVHLAYREASEAERQFLSQSGTLSEIAKLRAMARTLDGVKRSLIQLQAVDGAYPLYGAVTLAPVSLLAVALNNAGGVFGAVAEKPISNRLGLRLGDRFRIGESEFELRGFIEQQPDVAFGGLAFGPRVIVSQAALSATGLVLPGALVEHEYRLKLPTEADAERWALQARASFPEAGWQIRTADNASPGLQRFIERVGFFLGLVGFTALLVGGIGIGNAVAGYVASKTATIAILKCLGASTRLVFAAYLVQILVLTLAGIAGGLFIGGIVPPIVAPFLSGLLPIELRLGIYPLPLAIAALSGLLIVLAFALWPLAAIGKIPPATLFRDTILRARRRVSPFIAAATIAAALALAALVVLTAPDRRLGLWSAGGALVAFALFRLAGAAIIAVARRLPRPSWPILRLALGNLHRPGAPTTRVVLSLGLGLSVIAAVALVQGNLAFEVDTRLAERAPADFFIDIQPNQLADFGRLVNATPGASFAETPMLRGRITRINGTPVEQARIASEAQWALRSDRGLTYGAEPPPDAQIVAGKWWPTDYHGPPLVSFDAELARGMGLKVGDTLTVNLLGREVTATIANLRHIDWARLGINFAIVFAPGTLETAPQTRLAAVYVAPGEAEDGLVRQITERFPNVSAISVREGLDAVARVIATVGNALQLVALVTLATGIVVLSGAVAASHQRRIYDAVVLKVLGATRGTIAAVFLIEHGLLGLAAAIVAAAIGTGAAYALVTGPMRSEWVFLPLPLIAILGFAVVLALALGFTGTWRVLGARPAAYLRDE
ncbi:MAG: FtsX-like permease family protein [Alphaproteobacteria bacterium]|nr:FtsX-like permease family protein [Alphaproteobacteria bacterium]